MPEPPPPRPAPTLPPVALQLLLEGYGGTRSKYEGTFTLGEKKTLWKGNGCPVYTKPGNDG